MNSTPNGLLEIAAILLSLVFSYVPQVRDRYNALQSEQKQLLMLCLLAFAAVLVTAWSALGGSPVTQDSLRDLVSNFVLAVILNQGTYTLTKPKSDKQGKPVELDEKTP